MIFNALTLYYFLHYQHRELDFTCFTILLANNATQYIYADATL